MCFPPDHEKASTVSRDRDSREPVYHSGMTGFGAERKLRSRSAASGFAPMPSLRMDPAECPHSNILGAAFDNTQRGLGRRERHVEGNYGLGEAFEGERANLFGHDAPL